jgi:hypothetical protein
MLQNGDSSDPGSISMYYKLKQSDSSHKRHDFQPHSQLPSNEGVPMVQRRSPYCDTTSRRLWPYFRPRSTRDCPFFDSILYLLDAR